MQHILKCPLELLKLSWPETVRPDPLHLCLWMGSHPGNVVPWKLQMKNTDMWTHVWNLWCVLFPRKAWIWLWVLLGHAIFAGHGVYFEVGPKTFGWKELIHSYLFCCPTPKQKSTTKQLPCSQHRGSSVLHGKDWPSIVWPSHCHPQAEWGLEIQPFKGSAPAGTVCGSFWNNIPPTLIWNKKEGRGCINICSFCYIRRDSRFKWGMFKNTTDVLKLELGRNPLYLSKAPHGL